MSISVIRIIFSVCILCLWMNGSQAATPTARPTAKPTAKITVKPTARPTARPSTRNPTVAARLPTPKPTMRPTLKPTAFPTARPSTSFPTSMPSGIPSGQPTGSPTSEPSSQPTGSPTSQPTNRFNNPKPPGKPPGLGPGSITAIVIAVLFVVGGGAWYYSKQNAGTSSAQKIPGFEEEEFGNEMPASSKITQQISTFNPIQETLPPPPPPPFELERSMSNPQLTDLSSDSSHLKTQPPLPDTSIIHDSSLISSGERTSFHTLNILNGEEDSEL